MKINLLHCFRNHETKIIRVNLDCFFLVFDEEIQVLDNLDELRLHVGINSNTTGKVFFDDVVIEYNEQ